MFRFSFERECAMSREEMGLKMCLQTETGSRVAKFGGYFYDQLSFSGALCRADEL